MKAAIPSWATFSLRYVLCGKPDCAKRHGPYWYATWKARTGGRTRNRYVGTDARLAQVLHVSARRIATMRTAAMKAARRRAARARARGRR